MVNGRPIVSFPHFQPHVCLARRWVPALRALPQCRSRAVRAMAVDPDGLGTLLPRYVAPTRLPPPFADAARAVSCGGRRPLRAAC
jgi:hypothetical protein